MCDDGNPYGSSGGCQDDEAAPRHLALVDSGFAVSKAEDPLQEVALVSCLPTVVVSEARCAGD